MKDDHWKPSTSIVTENVCSTFSINSLEKNLSEARKGHQYWQAKVHATSEVEISEQQYPDDEIPEIPQIYNDSSKDGSMETQQDITGEKHQESQEDVPMSEAQEMHGQQLHLSLGKK